MTFRTKGVGPREEGGHQKLCPLPKMNAIYVSLERLHPAPVDKDGLPHHVAVGRRRPIFIGNSSQCVLIAAKGYSAEVRKGEKGDQMDK